MCNNTDGYAVFKIANQKNTGANLGGEQGVRTLPPHETTCGFLKYVVFYEKKKKT